MDNHSSGAFAVSESDAKARNGGHAGTKAPKLIAPTTTHARQRDEIHSCFPLLHNASAPNTPTRKMTLPRQTWTG